MTNKDRLKILFIPAWYPSKQNSVAGIFIKEHAKAVSLFNEVVVLYSEGIDHSIKNFYKIENNIEDGIRTLRLRYRKSPIPKTTYFIYLWSIFIGVSCFPKDTEALCSIATSYGYEFKTLQAVISANKRQRELMVEKIKHLLGDLKDKTIGVLGLAFKQNTDDILKSPSIDIIQLLIKEGAQIRCFDPLAADKLSLVSF